MSARRDPDPERPQVGSRSSQQAQEFHVLFISDTTALAPLVRSQGIPHLRDLRSRGVSASLLSFEPPQWTGEEQQRARALGERLADWGIDWHTVRRRSLPPNPVIPAALPNLLTGVVTGARIVRRRKTSVIHCRSYLPTTIGLALRLAFGARVIFDVRDLLGDLYVAQGYWAKTSIKYRLLKWLEGRFLRWADQVVATTEAFADQIRADHPRVNTRVNVIPNCVDTRVFDYRDHLSESPQHPSSDQSIVLVYSGSVATFWMHEEMLAFFQRILRQQPQARFQFLTYSDSTGIRSLVQKMGLDSSVSVQSVPHDRVPWALSQSSAALLFHQPDSYGYRFNSPIKLAEYLGCGLPVITNIATGDVATIIKQHNVGVIIGEMSDRGYDAAWGQLRKLLEGQDELRQRCRAVAERSLSLDIAVERYWGMYRTWPR